jgi:hypothetical protein
MAMIWAPVNMVSPLVAVISVHPTLASCKFKLVQ